MSILDWMRSKSPGAILMGWFEERRRGCRVLCRVVCDGIGRTVDLVDRRVRCVVEGVVARCFVVGQRDCILTD